VLARRRGPIFSPLAWSARSARVPLQSRAGLEVPNASGVRCLESLAYTMLIIAAERPKLQPR